jgi:hypothetical protein
MLYLRQSTASQEVPLGYFLDNADGDTEKTGLSIANTDIKIWKTGASSLVSKNSGGATHMANGLYYAVLDATDTNTLGPLVLFVHVSGGLAVRLECCVLAGAMFDWLFGTAIPLDAAATRSAVGLATANLDTQLSTIAGYIDTEVAAIKAKTDTLPSSPAAAGDAMALTSGERSTLAAAILDLANAIETGLTVREALRLLTAAEGGVVAGMTSTTVTIKNAVANSKTRITATVDADGNRSAVTIDLT